MNNMSNLYLIYTFKDLEFYQTFVGPLNQNIKMLELELNEKIEEVTMNDEIKIYLSTSTNVEILKKYLDLFYELYSLNIKLELRDLVYLINIIKNNVNLSINEMINFYTNKEVLLNTVNSKKISPKTLMQQVLIKTIDNNSVIFALGSAGTGKTYLAMAYAVSELKKNKIKKIVITRPAVEAGEKLGFLPGDLKEKVDPYLIPIYDALDEFLGKDQVEKLVEKGIIEIAPLAYMRGRTLDNAFVILDEAQNTTPSQMRMFLTRLGFNSKMIITGDITQIDLPYHTKSGLVEAKDLLKNIEGLAFVTFTKYDVMRHPIVSKIIEKYEMSDYNE